MDGSLLHLKVNAKKKSRDNFVKMYCSMELDSHSFLGEEKFGSKVK